MNKYEEVIKWFEDSCEPPCSYACRQCKMEAIALEVLREKVAQGNPKPLTLEELLLRDKKLVWCVERATFDESRGWIILDIGDLPKSWLEYGETWIAYDCPPGERP